MFVVYFVSLNNTKLNNIILIKANIFRSYISADSAKIKRPIFINQAPQQI